MQSRQLHDSGVKHKINVEEFHKKKREQKLYGARSEREVKDQLAEIERAAREAIAIDRQDSSYNSFYRSSSTVVTSSGAPPPPPPPLPPGMEIGRRGTTTQRKLDVGGSVVAEEEELEQG